MDRLNIKEKYKVQQFLQEDVAIGVISENIGKSENCINKYIANELIPLLDKIGHAKAETETKEKDVFLTDAIKEETIVLLVAGGIPDNVARNFIEKEIEPNLYGKVDNATALYKSCINQLAIHTAMVQKTAGGKSGVTIGTSAASQIAEEAKEKTTTVKPTPDHIFRPKG